MSTDYNTAARAVIDLAVFCDCKPTEIVGACVDVGVLAETEANCIMGIVEERMKD